MRDVASVNLVPQDTDVLRVSATGAIVALHIRGITNAGIARRIDVSKPKVPVWVRKFCNVNIRTRKVEVVKCFVEPTPRLATHPIFKLYFP